MHYHFKLCNLYTFKTYTKMLGHLNGNIKKKKQVLFVSESLLD